MDRNAGNESPMSLRKAKWKAVFAASLALLAGLLIIGSSFATPRRISYLLYYLNWYHWPHWYSVNLWILAVGAAVNYLVRGKWARRLLLTVVLAAFFTVTAFYSVWFHTLTYWIYCLLIIIHYSVFRPYFYAPLTELFSSGTVTWRLFIVPGIVLAVIGFLLFCRSAFSRNRNIKSEGPEVENKDDYPETEK